MTTTQDILNQYIADCADPDVIFPRPIGGCLSARDIVAAGGGAPYMLALQSGQRFGRWLIIAPDCVFYATDRFGVPNYRSRCICDCGTERLIHTDSLRAGLSLSCGCFAADRSVYRGATRRAQAAARDQALRSFSECAA